MRKTNARPDGSGKGAQIAKKDEELHSTTGVSAEQLERIKRQQAEPRDCPRFDRCSANICPLDADWRLRNHLKGERICFWLTELVKPGGMVRIDTRLSSKLAGKVSSTHPAIVARFCEIRYELKRAAKRPPRLGRRVGVRKREVA